MKFEWRGNPMEYKNVYETLREAQSRLLNTVILYDKEPGWTMAITDHKKDGIFRVYLLPIGTAMNDDGLWNIKIPAVQNYTPENVELGAYLDKWMEENPKAGMMRKHINAPAFNRFRPFPLGMWHKGDRTYYLAREPQRHREQGLTRSHLRSTQLSLALTDKSGGFGGHIGGPSMRATILGEYHDLRTCVEGLLDPEGKGVRPRESVAFHRDFGLVKGPLDFLFLFHKGQVVGLVEEENSRFKATLAPEFKYLREVTENTNSFNQVIVKER